MWELLFKIFNSMIFFIMYFFICYMNLIKQIKKILINKYIQNFNIGTKYLHVSFFSFLFGRGGGIAENVYI